MAMEPLVHILVINREGKSTSSLESENLRIRIFKSQAALDRYLLKHYVSIEHQSCVHRGNVEWIYATSKSGHKDVIIIRKEKLYDE